MNDVFLLDRERGRVRRLSHEVNGEPWWAPSTGPALDGAARVITFSSRQARDSGDVRADFDLFVLELGKW